MRTRTKFHVVAIGLAAAAIVMAAPASAKPARCFTTDDGYYPCEFRVLDSSGSFEISAPGRPTFSLLIEQPGFAAAYGDYGTGRNVALPGMYVREREEPACWPNPETGTKICAW